MPALGTLSRFDLLAAALQSLLFVGTVITVGVYVTKRSGNRKSNLFFAGLLTAFGLAIAALILEHLGVPARYPRLRYLPIWLTWSIGPTWFYYVKLTLFPAYSPRASDLKHALMPASQLAYYVYCFASGADGLRGDFLFGLAASTYEEFVFFGSVLGYLLASYRYLRYRARAIGARPVRWDYWRVKQLRHTQRVLVVLLVFNFGFVVYNFVVTQTSGTGLLHLRGFYASSSLTFGLILLYLLRGVAHRQHFSALVPPAALARELHRREGPDGDGPVPRLRLLMGEGEGYRDPNAHEVRVARSLGVSPAALDSLTQSLAGTDWATYLRRLRLTEVARLRARGLPLGKAALEAGFASRRAALRAFGLRDGGS